MGNKVNNQILRKVNVSLVVILTILTLGTYIGYWFLKSKDALKVLDKRKVISIRLWWVLTILLIGSFLYNFLGVFILTPYGNAIFNSFDVIFSFYYLGFLYYSVFRMKELLEERYEDVIFSHWLLVLFHVWYLQFKINRLEGDEHDLQKAKEVLA
jgi:hypothetical protein